MNDFVLYSGPFCPYSHRCRIVVREKNVETVKIVDVDLNDKPPEIVYFNPNNQVPVLVDRDLALYESNIINEYLDERFPHPHLMPSNEIKKRAKMRMLMHVANQSLFSHLDALVNPKSGEKVKARARENLKERLIELMPLFPERGFFFGEDFTMLDITLAPLLWRLPAYDIRLGSRATRLLKYAERVLCANRSSPRLPSSRRAMRK